MTRSLPLFGFVATALLLAGCASMTTMQTAETLDPGQVTYYGAWVPTTGPTPDIEGRMSGPDTNHYMTIEGGGRIGIINNLDAGVKIFPIGVVTDVKYRYFNNDLIHASGSIGFGYTTIGDDSTSKITIIDLVPSFPVTVRPFKWGAFTATPKALIRYSTGGSNSGVDILAGATAGLKFTTGTGSGYIEAGWFTGSYNSTYIGLGVERSFRLWGESKTKDQDENTPAPAPAPAPETSSPGESQSGSLQDASSSSTSF